MINPVLLLKGSTSKMRQIFHLHTPNLQAICLHMRWVLAHSVNRDALARLAEQSRGYYTKSGKIHVCLHANPPLRITK